MANAMPFKMIMLVIGETRSLRAVGGWPEPIVVAWVDPLVPFRVYLSECNDALPGPLQSISPCAPRRSN